MQLNSEQIKEMMLETINDQLLDVTIMEFTSAIINGEIEE